MTATYFCISDCTIGTLANCASFSVISASAGSIGSTFGFVAVCFSYAVSASSVCASLTSLSDNSALGTSVVQSA